MCGRYALYSSEAAIIAHFHLSHGFSMRSRYNIAPSQTIPIICDLHQPISFSRWGFIAPWASVGAEHSPTEHINARIESVDQKPTFKSAYQTQRCLIPASGYFEWRTFSGKKQPYYVFLKNQPLIAFAGIWSLSPSLSGSIMTCAILTHKAPSILEKLHERMPVIIAPDKYTQWLSKERKPAIETFMIPDLDANIDFNAVSPRMSHPLFEGIECIRAL